MNVDLMHGDCLELMKQIPDGSVDLVLTDPPYGIDFQSNYRKSKFNKIQNDSSINTEFLDECKRVLKDTGAIYCFTRWDVYPQWAEQISKRFKIKNCIVWFKRGGGLGDLKKDIFIITNLLSIAQKKTTGLMENEEMMFSSSRRSHLQNMFIQHRNRFLY